MTKKKLITLICKVNFQFNFSNTINIKKKNKTFLTLKNYIKYKNLIQLWTKLGKPN